MPLIIIHFCARLTVIIMGHRELFDACKLYDYEWTQRLLKAKADPNQQDVHGLTTLEYLVQAQSIHAVPLIHLLLQYGANPSPCGGRKSKL